MEVAQKIVRLMDFNVSKIVTEEDKGAALATTVSLLTGIPMAMARWYSYSLGVSMSRWLMCSQSIFKEVCILMALMLVIA